MSLSNMIWAFSLAFAMVGGGIVLAPSSAQAGQFISIGALKKNSIPCSVRGGTSSNCRPGAQANPPSRGCNKINRCRG